MKHKLQTRKLGALVFMLVVVVSSVLFSSSADVMAAGAGEVCNPKKRQCGDIEPTGFYTCAQKEDPSVTKVYSCQCRWGNLETGWWSLFGNDASTLNVCEFYLNEAFDDDGFPLPTSNPRGAVILLFTMLDGVAAFIMALTVMAALVMMVVGGYMYMTAGGNASQVAKAKSWIGSSIAGIFLAVLAFTILRLIAENLVTF